MKLFRNSPMVLAISLGTAVSAQPCDPGWHSLGGVNDRVGALTAWDPDGPGPAPVHLVAGGRFTEAGGVPVDYIATWNPVTGRWSKLGSGVDSTVNALATLPSGELVAAGLFRQAGGVVVNGVARWDGSQWRPFGGGVSGYMRPSQGPAVSALAVLPTGDLIIGGTFTHADDVEVRGIARWDGSEWRPIGHGVGGVGALAVMPDGSLLAGVLDGVVRWDGEAWALLGGEMTTGFADLISVVRALQVMADGSVVAGGYFSTAGGVPGTDRIARWDGSSWQSLGGGMAGGLFGITAVGGLEQLPSGDLVAIGWFDTAGGEPAANIARWDGAQWAPLGEGLDLPSGALSLLPSGDLAVGGSFQMAGGLSSPYLAIWRDCPSCYADCDGDGELTFFDFLCFQNLFAARDPAADCDDDGEFTFFDFLCFQNRFLAGCE